MSEPVKDVSAKLEFASTAYANSQNLIQFAESKANSLLVLDGLVFTVLAANFDRLKAMLLLDLKGGAPLVMHLALIVFAVSLPAALLAVLSVVMTRGGGPGPGNRKSREVSVVFYRDITRLRSSADYIDLCLTLPTELLLRDLLAQNYILAKIVEVKFDRFRLAFLFHLVMFASAALLSAVLFLKV